jgi:deoxyribonucleoside regulator
MENISSKRIRQSLRVARYYYQNNLDQSRIAQEMGLSRPTVSRLLQFARDNGYVQIEIKDPFEDASSLERSLEQKYNLEQAIVSYAPSNDYQTVIESLGKSAANYLEKIVTDGDIIGVAWGRTLREVARHLEVGNGDYKDVTVVQLKGSITHSSTNNFAHEVVSKFAKAFDATAESLPLPVIFDRPETSRLVSQDRHIEYIIHQGELSNIAVFTVGTVHNDALLFKLGYLETDEIQRIKKEAVGDIDSRFITSEGKIADKKLNERTIGIDLSELKAKDHSILVAGGERKLEAIKGALQGNYANVLVTDEETAKALLNDDTLE